MGHYASEMGSAALRVGQPPQPPKPTINEQRALDRFLDFADAVRDAHNLAIRPAYTETCPCGGSVEVGRDVSRADLRTIHADFLGRHIHCTKESS